MPSSQSPGLLLSSSLVLHCDPLLRRAGAQHRTWQRVLMEKPNRGSCTALTSSKELPTGQYLFRLVSLCLQCVVSAPAMPASCLPTSVATSLSLADSICPTRVSWKDRPLGPPSLSQPQLYQVQTPVRLPLVVSLSASRRRVCKGGKGRDYRTQEERKG